ncbi:MAG TPA: ImmA/IrrE family metallo-endopeptidase [Solirubrobacteraceae bacterium]|jgi:hypothetical protein|nr:ImmA/IrrE family metallo-endopeptidase [Solirubrobacteraceae bacterium]
MPELRLIHGGENDTETTVVDGSAPEGRDLCAPVADSSKLDPVAAALEVLRSYESTYGAGGVPPVPVEDIAESHLDLLIVECDDVRSVPGAPQYRGRLSGMIDPDRSRIWLDRTECRRSRGRRRFTIAHESGHWVLHVLGGQCSFSCRPQDIAELSPAEAERKRELARQEREANAFASELLMPELLVHEQARATGCNLPALAERFDVSVPAIRLRLLTLGLLPAWMASVPVVGEQRGARGRGGRR